MTPAGTYTQVSVDVPDRVHGACLVNADPWSCSRPCSERGVGDAAGPQMVSG